VLGWVIVQVELLADLQQPNLVNRACGLVQEVLNVKLD
jgi:hypothetical protein